MYSRYAREVVPYEQGAEANSQTGLQSGAIYIRGQSERLSLQTHRIYTRNSQFLCADRPITKFNSHMIKKEKSYGKMAQKK